MNKLHNLSLIKNSTFDPFLFLLSHILNKPINYMYCGYEIKYIPYNSNKKPLSYNCDKRHFWIT